MHRRSALKCTCRSAARRPRATATAKQASPRSTYSRSGSRSTSTSAVSCSARRSIQKTCREHGEVRRTRSAEKKRGHGICPCPPYSSVFSEAFALEAQAQRDADRAAAVAVGAAESSRRIGRNRRLIQVGDRVAGRLAEACSLRVAGAQSEVVNRCRRVLADRGAPGDQLLVVEDVVDIEFDPRAQVPE